MVRLPVVKTLAISLALVTSPAWAQSAATHPMLTNTWEFQIGAFFPTEDVKIQAGLDETVPGDIIDFNNTLGVDESDTVFAADLRWRFGEKWSVMGQYWASGVDGKRVLDHDVTWRDYTLEAGSNIEAGIDATIVRVFFGRTFWTGDNYEFGAGAGFHWLELSAYIKGEFIGGGGTVAQSADKVSAGAPLPNIGAWYIYALDSRWAFQARVDWLSASFDEYSGGLFNAGVSANYQFTDHFGAGLSYNYFNVDVDVDNKNWDGSAEMSMHGPFISANFNW
jgi:hypothetical protein